MAISIPAGAFVWDGMDFLAEELRTLPFALLILDGMDCSPGQAQEPHHLPMAWNLKPSQWGQPLTFQARPLRSRAGGRRW